ncbi:MAG: exodeoxyribonuclease VII large subunit [Ignavibacteria bacterium]|nr:MAG: exodeoxyribonuclease VII large subunit [Chlorobi bacterium OLB4]MBV6398923.1 Exodeoxyribonuclease 7 large subunit [Ignavibacteria bacterium]MBW7855470.1 exodeoxyribonuclease VII large subunit [Ignavibacteria bacterium]MCC6886238.1 exodeoxyribonuclease VII large subunit [Ignavibacteriales bacterium]
MNQPITVSELNARIRSVLENEFTFVYVEGEISNFKKHYPSGHFYFVLKDSKSQIQVTMWRAVNEKLGFTPEDGMKVIIKGRIRLYASRGIYNIEAFDIKSVGIGELQLAFEALKNKLFKEGLFNEEHKREIPRFPEQVGILTSETGAVIKDFIKITSRRFPLTEILHIHANVQGLFAAPEIVRAIKILNKPEFQPDVIVIARGGGSLEDLWSFNEESVARAIYASDVPVVSAIGHEVDYTICDFVADLRAPTPSAAAELIFPDSRELLETIKRFEYTLHSLVDVKISTLKSSLDEIEKSYVLKRPGNIMSEFMFNLDHYQKKLERIVEQKLFSYNNGLKNFERYIHGINPKLNLKRGYSIVRKSDKIINDSRLLRAGDEIEIEFADNIKKSKII